MENRTTINYIRVIAETRSISVAAEKLGISQPGLSAYLKKKEQELETTLFDRSKQPLELTEAGKAYLDYLDKDSVLQRELAQILSDIDNLNAGHLSIGGAGFYNVAFVPNAIDVFSKKYPKVDIEIIDDKVPELVIAAQNGMLDLFLTPFNNETDRFSYEELFSEKVFLAVPRSWEVNRVLTNKECITKEQFELLCEHTFIVLKEDQNIGQIIEELFEKYECRPKRIITAEQTMTTLALTRAGVGVSLITENCINNSGLAEFPELYLAELYLADRSICQRTLYIAYPNNKYLSKPAKEFIRIIKSMQKNK